MSLLDSIGPFPRDIIVIVYLKRNHTLYRWLQEEARKRGMSVERYIAVIIEEKAKEGKDGKATSGLE